MTEETKPAAESGDLVGLVPLRLAVPTRSKRVARAFAEQHDAIARQSVEWQKLGAHALFWEMGATVSGADQDRMYAMIGQMAAAGEQLGLALAAAIEVALWRSEAAQAIDVAAAEMATRAMAEAQSLFVIGGGHAVANVGVRALALDRDLRKILAQRFKRNVPDPFGPFSNEPGDWVSINKRTARHLEAVAAASGSSEVVALIQPVVTLARDEKWMQLVERRGEDFHRWRPQSHGVMGVTRSSPWKREGSSRVLGVGTRSYEDARELADLTAALATEGMVKLAESMDRFLTLWPDASNRLGRPRYGSSEPAGDT